MPMQAAVRDDAVRHLSLFCENRSAEDARLEHSVRGNSITLVERRPPWSELVGPGWTSMKIAQLRYDSRSRMWSLYAADRGEHGSATTTSRLREVGPLLAEIGDDPIGIFRG
jgi:Protein of unknown function (DUF3024)